LRDANINSTLVDKKSVLIFDINNLTENTEYKLRVIKLID
jgi:hypothetical protein